MSTSLLRGPGGALWRARNSSRDGDPVTFQAWVGEQWVDLSLKVDLPLRGYVSKLIVRGEHTYAVVRTADELGTSGVRVYELLSSGSRQRAEAFLADTQIFDAQVDSNGAVVVAWSGWATADQRSFVAAARFDGTSWTEVYRAFLSGAGEFGVQAGILGDQLILATTRAKEWVDIGFQHYSDCDLVVERVKLAAQ